MMMPLPNKTDKTVITDCFLVQENRRDQRRLEWRIQSFIVINSLGEKSFLFPQSKRAWWLGAGLKQAKNRATQIVKKLNDDAINANCPFYIQKIANSAAGFSIHSMDNYI